MRANTATATAGLEKLGQRTSGAAGSTATARKPRPTIVGFKVSKKPTVFQEDFGRLAEGLAAGHMGHYEYSNGGMKKWDEFLRENDRDYYIPVAEQALINRCADTSTRLLSKDGIRKITLVSRGPGTKFSVKEGALITAFKAAGIEVAKVVYIDVSKEALRRSKKEGESLLPNAIHETVQGDIFDPETKNEYQVVGTEVGTCFGLTPMNAEGQHRKMPPLNTVEDNLKGIRKQMKKGSHFIAAYDHTDDKKVIEKAYCNQEKFAKHMLTHHLGWDDTKNINFKVEFNEISHILAHGFEFTKDRSYNYGSRVRKIVAGTTLWFNNSVKLPKDVTEECHEHAKFEYLEEGKSIMAENDNDHHLGYHHLRAA